MKSGESRHVWIINHYAITPDLPGGTRHYDFGCELSKSGFKVRVFASDVNLATRRHTKLQSGQLWREESVNGVDFVWVRTALYRSNDIRRVWNMISFAINVFRVGLGRGMERPQTIIGSSPHPFAALSGWALSKLTGARFVLELRDLWPQALIDMGGLSERSLSVRLMRLLEQFLYRSAARIVILAPGVSDYLIERGVPPDRVVYIPNGVHLGNFRVGPCVVKEESVDSHFIVMYTGAHGPANSLETVLQAAQRLLDRSEIRFVLVGDGPSKTTLMRQVETLGLRNVEFMDPVPKAQVPGLLSTTDITLISLRRADAFGYAISPNKVFDYMAAGKPVLCAVPGEIAHLVASSGAGLAVDPENPEALAATVRALAALSREEREEMGRKGRLLIETRFSREKLAQQLAAIV